MSLDRLQEQGIMGVEWQMEQWDSTVGGLREHTGSARIAVSTLLPQATVIDQRELRETRVHGNLTQVSLSSCMEIHSTVCDAVIWVSCLSWILFIVSTSAAGVAALYMQIDCVH